MSTVWSTPAPPKRLDWHAIKNRIDLPSVAVDLLGPPEGRRGDRGHRLWWRCPFHDDNNPSLSVDRERRDWRCWGCGEHGDAAALVMKWKNLTFPGAVRWLADFSPSSGVNASATPNAIARAPTRPPEQPSGLPLADASALMEAAARRLWTPEGVEALEYLRGPRGLTDETIRSARLGYVDSVAIPTRDGDRSYRASGISIPWFDGDRLALAKIRQFGDRKPKYAEAFRDRPRVYPSLAVVRPGRSLVVVEGEFDALLLGQAIGDHSAIVTMGSASSRTDPEVRRAVRGCSSLYVAHDADDAGDKAAASWPARAVRVRPPEPHNDWTEVHASGFNRLRYLWGKHLPMSTIWEGLASQRWGPTDDEPDDPEAEAAAERAAIQAESGVEPTEAP